MEYVGQFHFFFPLLQNNNVTPTSRWVLTLEIMLDGIGKDVSLSLAVFLSILLTAKHNGLSSIDLVDAINDCIKSLHLFKLFSICVKQVLLNWTVRPNPHDYDTCFLIVIALTVEFLKDFIGSFDNGDCRAGGGEKTHFLKVPVLRQVFTESIGVEKYAYDGRDRTLLT